MWQRRCKIARASKKYCCAGRHAWLVIDRCILGASSVVLSHDLVYNLLPSSQVFFEGNTATSFTRATWPSDAPGQKKGEAPSLATSVVCAATGVVCPEREEELGKVKEAFDLEVVVNDDACWEHSWKELCEPLDYSDYSVLFASSQKPDWHVGVRIREAFPSSFANGLLPPTAFTQMTWATLASHSGSGSWNPQNRSQCEHLGWVWGLWDGWL